MTVLQPITEEEMDQWIVALRSGKYDQAKGQLATADGFCCLGVLREELKLDDVTSSDLLKEFSKEVFYKLPIRRQKFLASMNDKGCSFNEIAAYLEGHKELIIASAQSSE